MRDKLYKFCKSELEIAWSITRIIDDMNREIIYVLLFFSVGREYMYLDMSASYLDQLQRMIRCTHS